MKITLPKPLTWVGASKKDLLDFPGEVRQMMGFALYAAQQGDKHIDAKPLKGFNGAKTLEIVESYHGDTYRAVYTVKFEGTVYVLHCFQKKSKKGISTPKPDIDLIKQRLKDAESLYLQEKKRK
ncbi:MAG: addiction module toxin RelE [Methylomarinum sp.]|nr:addiction module toxin RelE [Methylomarinum sp.]